jgi:hypothetical protein
MVERAELGGNRGAFARGLASPMTAQPTSAFGQALEEAGIAQ